MYLRIRLEDGDATVFKGEPDQEDLQAAGEGEFVLIKFEEGNYLAAEVTEDEDDKGETTYEATWAKVGGV